MGIGESKLLEARIAIEAPPDVVFDYLATFGDMSWAGDIIKSVESVGEKRNVPGAKRIVNGVIKETLIINDRKRRVHSYTIEECPLFPKTIAKGRYITSFEILETIDGKCVAQTKTTYAMSGDPEEDETIRQIYFGFLSNLKLFAEKKAGIMSNS